MGIASHRDFTVVERLFGDVNADACDAIFQFGRNSDSTDISTPHQPSAQADREARVLSNSAVLGKIVAQARLSKALAQGRTQIPIL